MNFTDTVSPVLGDHTRENGLLKQVVFDINHLYT